jgi:hypothetical protein
MGELTKTMLQAEWSTDSESSRRVCEEEKYLGDQRIQHYNTDNVSVASMFARSL